MKRNLEITKIIDDFLPDKIFDAHMHISHLGYASVVSEKGIIGLEKYLESIKKITGDRQVSCNMITYPVDALKNPSELQKSAEFLASQLDLCKNNIGEIMVMPSDTAENIEKRILHKQILGLKCYWTYTKSDAHDQSNIEDYLPESAWEVADKNNMFITLHMVKDKALADEENLEYIKKKAAKYKNAKLILAHCCRAFAGWTVFETVDELVGFDNIFFDFSAISEVAPMAYIIQKCGKKRCMWGSDYPICDFVGKPLSISDTFYWLLEDELKQIKAKNTVKPWRIGVENVMATYQTAKILGLSRSDVEDLFHNNAKIILK